MSCKELIIKPDIGEEITIRMHKDEVEIDLGEYERSYLWLNHNQAHLLKLWLEEHLK